MFVDKRFQVIFLLIRLDNFKISDEQLFLFGFKFLNIFSFQNFIACQSELDIVSFFIFNRFQDHKLFVSNFELQINFIVVLWSLAIDCCNFAFNMRLKAFIIKANLSFPWTWNFYVFFKRNQISNINNCFWLRKCRLILHCLLLSPRNFDLMSSFIVNLKTMEAEKVAKLDCS